MHFGIDLKPKRFNYRIIYDLLIYDIRCICIDLVVDILITAKFVVIVITKYMWIHIYMKSIFVTIFLIQINIFLI